MGIKPFDVLSILERIDCFEICYVHCFSAALLSGSGDVFKLPFSDESMLGSG
ncbi:MAG: hypothetical protein ACUVUU_07820 [bacterium]